MADVSKISPDNGVNIYDLKDIPARNMMTDAFSTSTSYAIGDYCIYDGVLYKCTTAHTGTWNVNDFTATTIANELKNAGGGGDMSSYQTKTLKTPLTINGSSRTTVESALGALNSMTGANIIHYVGQVTASASEKFSLTTCVWEAMVPVDSPVSIVHLRLGGTIFDTKGSGITLVNDSLPAVVYSYSYGSWTNNPVVSRTYHSPSRNGPITVILAKRTGYSYSYIYTNAGPNNTSENINLDFIYFAPTSSVKAYGANKGNYWP
jgi:hypothetical protein